MPIIGWLTVQTKEIIEGKKWGGGVVANWFQTNSKIVAEGHENLFLMLQ